MARELNEQKYCSWCGATVRYDEEWMSVCSACGYRKYTNPNPCSNIMVRHKNKILMVVRNIDPQKGKTDLPGGFMDMSDESIEFATYRELLEEIGLTKEDVSELKYLASRTVPYEWQETNARNVCLYFVCDLLTDESAIKVDEKENTHYMWVGKDELADIDYAWDIDRQMLTKYFKEL